MTAFKLILRIAAVTAFLVLAAAPAAGHVYAEDFAECDIPVTCRISDDIPVDMGLDFTYRLEADSSDCPMPKGSDGGRKTVHMTDSGEVDFGTIRFDKPDVFHYTLMETTAEKGRFRRDKAVYHTTLVADTDGNVNIIVNNDNGKKPEKIEFVNSYLPKEVKTRNAPKTGDSAGLRKYVLLLLVCGLAAAALGLKKKRRLLPIAAAALLLAAAPMESSYAAGSLVSTINDYNNMPVNYAEISSLDFSQAQFTSLNSKIQKGPMEFLLDSTVTRQCIYWKSSTAPSFGTSNATTTKNANLAFNTVSGDLFTLRFSRAAKLSDGTTKDVLMTFSNLIFGLSLNTNGTTGSTYYYPIIRINSEGEGLYCTSGVGTGTTNAKRLKGVRSATRIQTTIKIVEPGTNTVIPEKHYILGFRDLDVKDNTTATGDNVDRYNGRFAEGIGLCSGYDEPAYLCEGTHTVQEICDDKPKFRGTQLEESGMKSGFDIPVSSSGFTYYWYGSVNMPADGSAQGYNIGTEFGYSPRVTVLASATEGGTIQKEGVTEYLVNTSTSYDYTPSSGYRVKRLTVDGRQVSFNENGGTYVFQKLTSSDDAQYDHTISVVFRKQQDLIITNSVKGNLGDRKKNFQFVASLTGLESNGQFEISSSSTGSFTGVGEYGARLNSRSFQADSSGRAVLRFTIRDGQFIQLLQLTGTSYYTITEERSDHDPSFKITGDGSAPQINRTLDTGRRLRDLSTLKEMVEDGDGTVTVEFINQKTLAAPTGVRDSRAPLISAALVLAALIVLL